MGNMMIQSSLFDFADVASSSVKVEHAPGTWSYVHHHTHEEYDRILREAEQGICSLPLVLRLIYAQGIEAFADRLPIKKVAGPVFCCPAPLRVTAASFAEILTLASGRPVAGIETKHVENALSVKVGVYVQGVGSLYFRQELLPLPGMSAYFTPERDRFFLDSYSDEASTFELPAQIFIAAMSSQLIGAASDKPANVRTFEHMGREYVTSQLVYRGSYCEAKAWSVCSRADFDGKTYTHAALLDAYNAGSVERGDLRGLLVTVRGQACVLDRCALCFDRSGGSVIVADRADEVDLQIDDFDDEEDCE